MTECAAIPWSDVAAIAITVIACFFAAGWLIRYVNEGPRHDR